MALAKGVLACLGIGTISPANGKLDVRGDTVTAICGSSTNNYGIRGESSGSSVAVVIECWDWYNKSSKL